MENDFTFDVDFSETLKKALGLTDSEVLDLLEKLDVDQLTSLIDASVHGDDDAIRDVVGNTLNDVKKADRQPKTSTKRLKRPERSSVPEHWNIGDSVSDDDDEEAVVKIPHAPGDTVGVMKNGELKMIDKDDVTRVDEGVLGMTGMPGIKRMQELAGISPADNVEVPAPVTTVPPAPATSMAPPPVAVGDMGGDMGMDDEMPLDAPGSSELGAMDMADMHPELPDPSAAVDALNDAEALDNAISEIERMIPQVRISEYKTLVTRLKSLVSMAEQAGRAALTESRTAIKALSPDAKFAQRRPASFDDAFGKRAEPEIKKKKSSWPFRREMEEGSPDTPPRHAIPNDDSDDADGWLMGDDEDMHSYRRPRERELDEQEIEEAPQPVTSKSTPKKKRMSQDDNFDTDDWLMGDEEDVSHYAPKRRHELDEDKFKEKGSKAERKTLMDYIKEVDETNTSNPNDPKNAETLGDDRNKAIQSLQARMGDNTTPQDATRAFDKLRGQGKVKQDGAAFTMPAMGDEQLNKSLQEKKQPVRRKK